jgi:hypothetical protein
MTTPADQTPAEGSQDPGLTSSPVKGKNNLGVADRKQVQKKVVPPLLRKVPNKDFLKLLHNAEPQVSIKKRIPKQTPFVDYLNLISDAVCRHDKGKWGLVCTGNRS